MKKQLAVAAGAAIALGLTAGVASAQCTYQHPSQAKAFKSALVQAMVSCGNPGGNVPNTTTAGGVAACAPVESITANNGNPSSGWAWGPKSSATLGFQADKNKLCSTLVDPMDPSQGTVKPPCPPTDLNTGARADLRVTLKMKDIQDQAGDPASGLGKIVTLARATLNDPESGAVTVVDFPANFEFDMSLSPGKANVKTSTNALLNGIGQNALPQCSAIETVSLSVSDTNGNTFARPGVFLPIK